MRARELRELSDEELGKRLAESREELFNLRFQAATGALENSARLNLTKRDIARIPVSYTHLTLPTTPYV